MNDYELIYLFRRNLDSESIFKIFVNKYNPLIYKTLISFFGSRKDDYYNEALYILLISLKAFDETKNKSFAKYFQLRLKWHLIKVITDENKYVVCDVENLFIDEMREEEVLIYDSTLSDFEYTVYVQYYHNKEKIEFISKQHNKTDKQIYNTLYRIREKLKKENNP
jgi:RNA polymerase sporulation-specific sigma factor